MSGHFIETDNFVIVVDKWDASYVRRAGNKPHYFFLTHLHADHIKGLTSTWSRIIYTSPFNAWLLPIRRSVRPELLRPLDLEMTHTIQKPNDGSEFQVTVLDANHCPGSVMFLFQGSFGNILYTGDFRYQPSMLNNPSLADVVRKKELNVMYLDNTYADPSCKFPSREEALQEVLQIVDEYPDYKFLIGLRQLGKEEVLRAIALHLNERVCVSPQRLQVLAKLEYEDVFTTDNTQSRIHAVELHTITHRHGQENTRQISIRLSSIYECASTEKRVGNIFNVAYSDHSSHSELRQCVRDMRPHKLVPIVIPKVLDTTKYANLWSRMSSVNCVIPNSILSLCGPASPDSRFSSVVPPSTVQRTVPLVIKYHLTKDQQTMKHADEGSLVPAWDAQGPQFTVNNKARKHIKASWTRLAPKLLSQRGISFNESNSPTSDSGLEMENLCNGISTPQLPWRGVKRKRDIDPRSPLAVQNKTSESEGEESVLEVPLSEEEDGLLSMPSSAMDLQLHLMEMKDSASLKNGVKRNGVNLDVDVVGKSLQRKEVNADCLTDLEAVESNCDMLGKKSLKRNMANGNISSTNVVNILNAENGAPRRQSLARTVKQSPPDKAASVSVTKKPGTSEIKAKTKNIVKKSTLPKEEKVGEKKLPNTPPVGALRADGEVKDKEANRVTKITRRSLKETFGQDASIDSLTLNTSQQLEIKERSSGTVEEEGTASTNHKETLAKDTKSKEVFNSSSEVHNIEKTSALNRENVDIKPGSETNSPHKKSPSGSLKAIAAWTSAEELVRKQTEQALKALEALNDMKGFKTRGCTNRTGGLKVASELINLRRASGDSNPVFSATGSSGPKVRSRNASILSSMASTFEKDALRSPPSNIESPPKAKQSSERNSPKAKSPVKPSSNDSAVPSGSKNLSDQKIMEIPKPFSERSSPKAKSAVKPSSNESAVRSGSKNLLDQKVMEVQSLATAASCADTHGSKTENMSSQVGIFLGPNPAKDAGAMGSDRAMKVEEIIKRQDLARIKRASLNVGLMRLKVDIAMNSKKKERRSSLPANLSSYEDMSEISLAAPREKVQTWRSKISSLTKMNQQRYKYKSPLKLRHSVRLSLMKIQDKEQPPSTSGENNQSFEKKGPCGKHSGSASVGEEFLLMNEQGNFDSKFESDTQSCCGALESVHHDIKELRRHSLRLSEDERKSTSVDASSNKVSNKSGKQVEKSEVNLINDEEPQRRQSFRLSKKAFSEPVQSNTMNDSKSEEQSASITEDSIQGTKRQSLRLTEKGSRENKTSNINPKPNAVKEIHTKRQSPRGHGKEERRVSRESNSSEKSLKKQLSLPKDSKTTKKGGNSVDSSSHPSPKSGNPEKEKLSDVIDLTEDDSKILSFGSENAQKTCNVLSQMSETLKVTKDTNVENKNILTCMSQNPKRLNPLHQMKPVPSSLSIQLLPENLGNTASSSESVKSDWSIQIVPISSSNRNESKSRNDQEGIASCSVADKRPVFSKRRFNDLKTPDSLSIKLMSSTESNSRKEPSPPSLSISVADDDDDVVLLSEESTPIPQKSHGHSVKQTERQHRKLLGGSQWSPVHHRTSKYVSETVPAGDKNRFRKPVPSLIQPPPQAIWKENYTERTLNRSGDSVVVVDIETEQDHCPVHCTCGQAATKRNASRQAHRDFDEDSDSSSLYEVPLSPEDFAASQAMVAFGEGWLDVCFDGEEDKEEFLASYEPYLPYLPKAVHQSHRFSSEIQEVSGKSLQNDQNTTSMSTLPAPAQSSTPEPSTSKSQQQEAVEAESIQPDATSVGEEKPGEEKPRKPSTDSSRSDSLLKEIEKKIRAYNEQQSKKRLCKDSGSPSSLDGCEPKRSKRRTEIEILSETRQRSASKKRYRNSVRRSLDHLMTRQKLRSEKRSIVSSANHS